MSAGDHLTEEHFTAMLANDKDGNKPQYARTGYLGFVKRTELTQTDGGITSLLLEHVCKCLCYENFKTS